jgi:hypothetical protein
MYQAAYRVCRPHLEFARQASNVNRQSCSVALQDVVHHSLLRPALHYGATFVSAGHSRAHPLQCILEYWLDKAADFWGFVQHPIICLWPFGTSTHISLLEHYFGYVSSDALRWLQLNRACTFCFTKLC